MQIKNSKAIIFSLSLYQAYPLNPTPLAQLTNKNLSDLKEKTSFN